MKRTFALFAALALTAGTTAAFAQETASLAASASESFGAHVTTGDGTPVYVMETDVQAGDGLIPLESCQQNCLDDWAYVISAGKPSVGEGLDPGLASFVEWNGESIATYDGRVLFTFVQEGLSDEPDGQGVHAHGGRWYLLIPEGGLNTTGAVPPEGSN